MTENDLAYMAGLFDGEGSVSYYQRKEKRKGKKKAYNFWIIRCEISMTDEYVMKWFYEKLGFGSLRKRYLLNPGRVKSHNGVGIVLIVMLLFLLNYFGLTLRLNCIN